MSAGTWESFSWGSPGLPPRGPGSRAVFGSPPWPGGLQLPFAPHTSPGPPRPSGAALADPGSPEQEAPSSGGEPPSAGTSPVGISDPMVAEEESPAPGGLVRAPEGLTLAGRSRPARDRAAPSAAALEEGGEGSAARRGWQQDGAGGAGAEELRVAE